MGGEFHFRNKRRKNLRVRCRVTEFQAECQKIPPPLSFLRVLVIYPNNFSEKEFWLHNLCARVFKRSLNVCNPISAKCVSCWHTKRLKVYVGSVKLPYQKEQEKNPMCKISIKYLILYVLWRAGIGALAPKKLLFLKVVHFFLLLNSTL